MPRSRDFRKYVIVTKKPDYTYHFSKNSPDQKDVFLITEIEANHQEVNDKTFWLYTKEGELVGRYSTESAPKWVQEVYNILTNE